MIQVKEAKKKAQKVKKKKENILNLLLIKYPLIKMPYLGINLIGQL